MIGHFEVEFLLLEKPKGGREGVVAAITATGMSRYA